ncbi:hypothetical protein H4Q26_013284 [Puccinia striiformis f. sp. tritici PST-130]|nr:hypothetical protein H4Q26_013284 [Puccinia striiformis f. sp. tritici PST-130]
MSPSTPLTTLTLTAIPSLATSPDRCSNLNTEVTHHNGTALTSNRARYIREKALPSDRTPQTIFLSSLSFVDTPANSTIFDAPQHPPIDRSSQQLVDLRNDKPSSPTPQLMAAPGIVIDTSPCPTQIVLLGTDSLADLDVVCKPKLPPVTFGGREYLASVLTMTVTNDELVFSTTDGATLELYDGIDPAAVAAIWDIPKDALDEEDIPTPSAPHSTALLLSSTSPTNPDPAYFTPSPTLASSSGTPDIFNLATMELISVTYPTEAPVSQQMGTKYEKILYKAKLADYLEYLRENDYLQNHSD